MKKLIYLTIILLFPIVIYSQKLTEKAFFNADKISKNIDPYSLKIDEKSGTYIYQDYDSVTKKNIILSNKGNSGPYDYPEAYSAIFDSDGNYYIIAYNNTTDTTFAYFILKNGKEIASYDLIVESWNANNNIIYYICKENNKTCLAMLDMTTDKVSKGKSYDDIIPCSYPANVEGDEPSGNIGITNDGKPYYVAKSNDEAFLVIGTEEQKHYSDIDAYSLKTDAQGNFVYPAKSNGKFYDAGSTFIVKGNKEYKKFDYIYAPIYFDIASGDPVYIGADSTSESVYTQRLMIGDKEASKTYTGGIWNVDYTLSGKLYYVASNTDSKGNSTSFLVFDGKESKQYQSIGIIKILPGDKLLYTANVNDDKQVIVNDKKETEMENGWTVLDFSVAWNGNLVYVAGKYGNYEKKTKDKFYVYIGDDEFGPYDGVLSVDYTNNSYVLTDKANNYVYLTNKIKDAKNYVYKYILYWNDNNSEEFDNIENVSLINGKPLYTASNYSAKNATTKYKLYYGDKSISSEYENITDYKYNDATKLVTFTGLRGKEFYKVEIQF